MSQITPKCIWRREKMPVILYCSKPKKSLYLLGKTIKQNLKRFLFVASFFAHVDEQSLWDTYVFPHVIFITRLSYRTKGCMLL